MADDPAGYGPKLDEALAFVADAFRHVRRKGTDVPYLTHLCQVMVWVGEHGGDEAQMIAALLHDTLEDVEGVTADQLEARFGPRVRRLVEALSDTTQPTAKPPWRARKEAYLRHLRGAPPEVKLISACDKLHNALSIVRDLETEGEALWSRFTGDRDGTLWYYRALLDVLAEGWSHPLLGSLREAVRVMHAQAGEPWDGSA